MESDTDPKKQFEDSTRAFLQAWTDMERFDKQTGDRELSTAEKVEGVFRLTNLLARMMIAFRDGDNWLKGH